MVLPTRVILYVGFVTLRLAGKCVLYEVTLPCVRLMHKNSKGVAMTFSPVIGDYFRYQFLSYVSFLATAKCGHCQTSYVFTRH